MTLEYLVYSNLMEETVVEGWDKDTIDYLIANERKVKSSIRNMLNKRHMNFVDTLDIEDVYSDVLEHMYGIDDYDINRAIVENNSDEDYIISLEDYVFSNVKNCVSRYLDKRITLETLETLAEINNSDGDTIDIFSLMSDGKSDLEYEDTLVDLKEICKEYENQRYKYGIDIYLLWLIGLSLIDNNLESKYNYFLDILGYSRKDLEEAFLEATEDEMIIDFAAGINKIGINASINIIKEYVYSADNVLKAIESLAA